MPSAPASRVARTVDRMPPPAVVQLLVARARGAERELLDAVAAERRMRMAVDEAGDRAEPAPVELDDVAVDRPEIRHAPDVDDPVVGAQDERVVDPVDVGERAAAERRVPSRRRDDLGEVADQQTAHAASLLRRIASADAS